MFGETLVFERLLAESASEEARLELLAGRIDDAIATVFRQIAMNRFEHLVHTRRRDQGELSVDDLNVAWVESQAEMLGDAVEITEGYHSWWSYIPHFINTPGYVYAYAFGCWRYRSTALPRGRRGVRPALFEMLGAGGLRTPSRSSVRSWASISPDPGFWDSGPAAGR